MATRRKTAGDREGGGRRAPVPVYLFFGSDEYAVSTAARQTLDALCPPEEQTLGAEEIDGRAEIVEQASAALRRVLGAVRTPSLFGGRKVVWFRDVNFLKHATIPKSEAVAPWLAELTALIKSGLPARHHLVISATAVDRRSALYKACDGAGAARGFDVPAKAYLVEREAGEKARAAFRAAGLRPRADAMAEFVARTGADSRRIVGEVEKLSVYLGGEKDVGLEDVRAVVPSSREALGWDLSDAVGERNLPKALALVRQLLFQKVAWPVLMGVLEGRFRDLAVARECLDRRWLSLNGRNAAWFDSPEAEAALSALGPRDPRRQHPFRAGILAKQAQQFSAAELARRRADILATREQMVSGFSDADLLLEFLVIRLAAPARRRAVERVAR